MKKESINYKCKQSFFILELFFNKKDGFGGQCKDEEILDCRFVSFRLNMTVMTVKKSRKKMKK